MQICSKKCRAERERMILRVCETIKKFSWELYFPEFIINLISSSFSQPNKQPRYYYIHQQHQYPCSVCILPKYLAFFSMFTKHNLEYDGVTWKSFNLPKLQENRLDIECSACKHGLFMNHEECNKYKSVIFYGTKSKMESGEFHDCKEW